MNLYHQIAPIYGQLLLAVLILTNSILSTLQKKRMEKREVERQAEIARNLEISQKLVMEHSELLSSKIELLKHELKLNTKINVDALNSANNFHEKLEEIKGNLGVQKVEIVQTPDDPILVREVVERKVDDAASLLKEKEIKEA